MQLVAGVASCYFFKFAFLIVLLCGISQAVVIVLVVQVVLVSEKIVNQLYYCFFL